MTVINLSLNIRYLHRAISCQLFLPCTARRSSRLVRLHRYWSYWPWSGRSHNASRPSVYMTGPCEVLSVNWSQCWYGGHSARVSWSWTWKLNHRHRHVNRTCTACTLWHLRCIDTDSPLTKPDDFAKYHLVGCSTYGRKTGDVAYFSYDHSHSVRYINRSRMPEVTK